MAMAGDENKVFVLFWTWVQAPGGWRTSLSLKARKSAASLQELRGVLRLTVYKSAVWALEAKVVERVQIDPGAISEDNFRYFH